MGDPEADAENEVLSIEQELQVGIECYLMSF